MAAVTTPAIVDMWLAAAGAEGSRSFSCVWSRTPDRPSFDRRWWPRSEPER